MEQKKTVLPNGLTIVTMEKPHAFTTVLGFSINAGSFDELAFPLGTAHFVEHMIFKGTTSRTNKQINKEINRVGGDLNAYTFYEETKYFSTTPRDSWKIGLDLLLDILWNPTFPEEEIDKERNVILEEIKMYRDDPLSLLFDTLQIHMLKNYEEKQTILGTEESVAEITREDLVRFVNTYYHPSNMTFVATGCINHEELVAALSSFPMERDNQVKVKRREFFQPHLEGSYSYEENMEQSYFAFGLFGPQANSEECIPFEVLSTILGGNESSRLFQKIREENGMAYLLSTNTEYLSDYGVMYGYVGTGEEHISEISSIIRKEMKKLSSNGITEEELANTISFMKGRALMEYDSSTALNDYISSAIIYDESTDPLDYLKELSEVTKEDVQRVAQKYFGKDNFITVSIIGKIAEEYEVEEE